MLDMFQVCIYELCATKSWIYCVIWDEKSYSLGTWPCFHGSKPEGCVYTDYDAEKTP